MGEPQDRSGFVNPRNEQDSEVVEETHGRPLSGSDGEAAREADEELDETGANVSATEALPGGEQKRIEGLPGVAQKESNPKDETGKDPLTTPG